MVLCWLKLSACRAEVSALQKDRDRLQDQAMGTLSADEVLEAARGERDALSDRLTVTHSFTHTYTNNTLVASFCV